MLIPLVLQRFSMVSSTAIFWGAYILTRPLGGSFADWMGVLHARDGLALGTGPVTAIGALLIVAVVVLANRRPRQR